MASIPAKTIEIQSTARIHQYGKAFLDKYQENTLFQIEMKAAEKDDVIA